MTREAVIADVRKHLREYPHCNGVMMQRESLDALVREDGMPKNAISINVKVLDDGQMPSRDRVVAWLTEQYDQAIERAAQNHDGTVTTYKGEFPCPEFDKE